MAMHAYGHEWACQLSYNPCLVPGLGLSDGEGTEWLWSRCHAPNGFGTVNMEDNINIK